MKEDLYCSMAFFELKNWMWKDSTFKLELHFWVWMFLSFSNENKKTWGPRNPAQTGGVCWGLAGWNYSQCSTPSFGGTDIPFHGSHGLAWFWWHQFQTTHPLAQARIVKVNKTAFQLNPLLHCQRSKLRKSCLLHSRFYICNCIWAHSQYVLLTQLNQRLSSITEKPALSRKISK